MELKRGAGVRLNKYIAAAGVASRRRADELIAAGKVRVNGRVVRELGIVVVPGDRVDVSGTPIAPVDESIYLVMYKPAGVVTTMRDPQGRRTVAQLLPPGPRVVPVGRLDYETSGVLLLTNDGDLAHRLLHPRYEIEKTYRATISGRLSPNDVKALHDGLAVGDAFVSAPAKVRVVAARSDHAVVDLTIHEGRNRQVRRMLEALGHRVLALERLRFGPIALGAMRPGEVRVVSSKELSALERAAGTGAGVPRTKRSRWPTNSS